MIDSLDHDIVCPGCGMLISSQAEFCPHCTAPVGPTIWMDPFKRIFASGYVSRKFTSGKPRKWVMITELVIGIGLLPVILYTWIEASENRSLERIANGLYALFFTIISIAFYYRIFKNYIRLYGKKNKHRPGD